MYLKVMKKNIHIIPTSNAREREASGIFYIAILKCILARVKKSVDSNILYTAYVIFTYTSDKILYYTYTMINIYTVTDCRHPGKGIFS